MAPALRAPPDMNLSGRILRFLLTLLVIGALAPVIYWGAQRALSTMYNAPPYWVPDSLPYRQDYDWYKAHFGTEDTVLVSWPGASIEGDELDEFAEALMSPEDEESRRRNEALFKSVVTGPQMVARLEGEPTDLTFQRAKEELRGSFVGPDGETSAALIVLTEEGGRDRQQMIDVVLATAAEVAGTPRDEIRLAGPPVDGGTIDAASMESIRTFTLPSMIIATFICWWCLRSVFFTGVIVAAAAFCQGLVLTLVNFSGHEMNAVLIIMPALAFVLTVSAGVHLTNYYRDSVKVRGPDDAPGFAVRYGWLPCTLAATTTMIGLGSLLVSDIIPVRVFGAISATVVIASVVLLFLLLPGVMEIHARTRAARRWAQAYTVDPIGGEHWLGLLARFVSRRPLILSLAFTLGMAGLLWGFTQIRTSINVRALFPGDSRIIRDYTWLEENIGPLVPIEVIVRFDEQQEADYLERMALVDDVHEAIAEMELADGVVSAATFFPPVPGSDRTPGERFSGREIFLRKTLSTRLEQSLEEYRDGRWLVDTEGGQAWRISARVTAFHDVDYGQFLDRLQQRIDPLIREKWGEDAKATYTGAMPVTYEAQRALLRDLFRSFLTAFLLVAVVMIVVLRSAVGGLLMMLPNLFPTLVLFGTFGWIGTPIDIGSVMTASVALGIAVDDTLHFLTWFRHETGQGTPRQEAVRRCFHHCGRAMTQTSLICGLGLLIYSLSSFVPTQRFSFMMLGLLMAALVGDLIYLPALLLTPLGKWIAKTPGETQTQSAESPADEPSAAHAASGEEAA